MLLFRNGLLTEHNLVEVNGQNVVGLKVGKVCLLKMLSSAKSEGTRVVALRLQSFNADRLLVLLLRYLP